MIDPVALSQSLIRCPSVTPVDAGALDVLQCALEAQGFTCQRFLYEDVDNLYARRGSSSPNLCFAGHTDVVPVGDEKAWSVDPFGGVIKDGILYGRGAVDMKCAIAAWVAACDASQSKGSLSLLITGDEEGIAKNGTVKVLKTLAEKGEKLDACIVGEPTNPQTLGEMIKIGRRGSVSFYLTAKGVQGHSAYPQLAHNPVTDLVKLLYQLKECTLDDGNQHFQASNLEVTSIDVGNTVNNVIPAEARAIVNIRFNNEHTSASLIEWVRSLCPKNITFTTHVSGEAFLTEPGHLSDVVSQAVKEVTGKTPVLSTTGGTSDARFIKDYCPVVEFGLINHTAHKVDERIETHDIIKLTEIYRAIIRQYFQ